MQCRFCGQQSAEGARFCECCGVQFPAPAPAVVVEEASEKPPPGWREYRDSWAGFSTWVPESWRAGCLGGEVHFQEDPRVPCCVTLGLARGASAAAMADQFMRRKASEVPGLQAWPCGTSTDEEAVIGFRAPRMRQGVEGTLEARLLAPGLVRLASWFAPPPLLGSRQPLFRQVVDRCRLVPALLRAPWIDPTEGAFGLRLPHGWRVQGGVQRQSAVLAQAAAVITDPTGTAWVRVGGESYPFQEVATGGGLAGLLGGWGIPSMMGPAGISMPFQSAVAFIQSFLLPRLRGRHPDLSVLRLEDRPDLVEALEQGMAREVAGRVGLEGAFPQGSAGEVVLAYSEGGVPFLERLGVTTMRIVMPSMMGAPSLWFAEVPAAYGAPRERFGEWEPVLAGIADSMKVEPGWQQAQRAAGNSQAMLGQADIARRRQEISRTLSETSDIVSQGYWSRAAISQDHASGRQAAVEAADPMRDWSNAMLGWEDRVDDHGQRWSIPAGHERVWRDPQGNVLTGNALTNPDPTWHELKLAR